MSCIKVIKSHASIFLITATMLLIPRNIETVNSLENEVGHCETKYHYLTTVANTQIAPRLGMTIV